VSVGVESNSGVFDSSQRIKVVVSYEHVLLPWASIQGTQFILSYRVDDGPIVRERAVGLNFIPSGGTAEYTAKEALIKGTLFPNNMGDLLRRTNL